MKKIFTKLMLWAVAATALVSCVNNFGDVTINGEENLVKVTLTADKPTVVSEARTELDGTTPKWSVGDQIGVYVDGVDKDGNPTFNHYAFDNDSEVASETTTFTGKTALSNTLYVYYPYVSGDAINDNGVVKANLPAAQNPTAGSFDGAADIMIAKHVTLDEAGTALNSLEFARLGAIVKVVLKDKSGDLATQHLSSLKMTAANDLAGKVYLDVINQELGALYDNTSRTKSVTANYLEATPFVDNANATYFVVYPNTLAEGSTLEFAAQTEDYKIAKSVTLPSAIALESGVITTLNVSLEKSHLEKIEKATWVDGAYNLIKNTNDLEVGDKVVIVAAGYDKAMGAQGGNNRAAVAVTKDATGTNPTVAISDEVAILDVEAGNIDGTFAFKATEGYLYAASSSSNYLRSEATLSANSSFLVTIADGIASVTAQGSYTHNIMKYNNSSSLFSCYASGQDDIAIYKLVGEYVIKAPAIKFGNIANVTINADATSGEATVSAENAEGWAITAATTATWVSNLAYANGKITFNATVNDSETENREATVTVTAKKADYEDVTAEFKIIQNKKAAQGGPTTVVDVLNRALTGMTGTSYSDWSGKTSNSTAVYKGQSAGGNDAIQLRSNNSNSGIVTTASGGYARKVVVTWNSSTDNGRTLEIYGKTTAYSAATDLYGNNKGTSLGTIVYGTSIELEITGNYEYIGLRSKSGAMYIAEIQITWESGNGGGETPTPDPEPATPVLSVNPSTLSFDAAAGSKTITCTIENEVSSVNVTASASATWLTTSVSGKTVTITASENTTTEVRNANVTIEYQGAESKTIAVSQAAAEATEPEQPGGGETESKTYTENFTTWTYNNTSNTATGSCAGNACTWSYVGASKQYWSNVSSGSSLSNAITLLKPAAADGTYVLSEVLDGGIKSLTVTAISNNTSTGVNVYVIDVATGTTHKLGTVNTTTKKKDFTGTWDLSSKGITGKYQIKIANKSDAAYCCIGGVVWSN